MKKLIHISLFTAFIWVLGTFSIPIPGIAVPLVLQNFGVLLAGSVLGVSGVFSVLILLLLAAMGFPVLAGARGGIAVFFGPTTGYLIGYILAALVVGLFTQRFWLHLNLVMLIVFNMLGILMIYLIGIPVLMIRANLELYAAIKTNFVFIPLDLVKAIFASLVAMLFKRYYPLISTYTSDDTIEFKTKPKK